MESTEDKPKAKPEKPRRPRGSGSLFKTDRSRFWVIGYRSGLKTIHESTKTTDRRRAEAILRARLTAVEDGTLPSRSIKDTTVDQLFALIEPNYELKNNRSFSRIEQQWRLHLRPELMKILGADFKAAKLTTDSLDAYVLARKKQGASNGSLRNELALLRRMYRLGSEKGKVRFVPKFHLPGRYDDNTRAVKFSDEEFANLEREVQRRSNFPLLVFIRAMRGFGWRTNELRNMRVEQFKVAESVVVLPPAGSKNKQPRRVKITRTMAEMFRALVAGKPDDALVFDIVDFYRTWAEVCVACGLGSYLCRRCKSATTANTQGLKSKRVRGVAKTRWCPTCQEPRGDVEIRFDRKRIPYDLRRSAASDLHEALVPDVVVCNTLGWNSTAMLKRYFVGSDDQTLRGQEQVEAYRRERAEAAAKALEALEATKSSITYVQPGAKTVEKTAAGKLAN